MEKAIIVSGYFNPLHKGHIEYFHFAKSLGEKLIVIVNNDIQRNLKGSEEFMMEDERCLIIKELSIVNEVFLSIDKDRTVIQSLKQIHKNYSKEYSLFFANGGDQNNNSIPENNVCQKLGINLIDGMGNKIQSSSWLLKK
jgi:glycerol-3-phosphate cytidylyltransferase/D-beta-D-heptose 7-phosphate kinase/D-beta-D-heptose 1-phosphate adenosyltransferase